MKKSIEQYEKRLERELTLIDTHKKNAAELRRLIAMQKEEQTLAAVKALNLNGTEYGNLMKLLKQDKKTFLTDIEKMFEEKEKSKEEKADEKGDEVHRNSPKEENH